MVDDVTTNLKVAASVLSPYYELSMAKSGKQALTYLKKNRPDLILLDIKMPDMDGYQTMEEIKLNPETADIPIIFLTADTEHESEIKGLRMGALDFITKPFEESVMLGRVEKVLQMEELRKKLIGITEKECFFSKTVFFDKVKSFHSEKKTGSFILLDLDDFSKEYHKTSKEDANTFVSKMKDELEKNEDNIAVCSNFDGDMFAFFVEGLYTKDSIDEFISKVIYKALKSANELHLFSKDITVSIGVCLYEDYITKHEYDCYYHNADKALYFAKNNGKDQIHYFKK